MLSLRLIYNDYKISLYTEEFLKSEVKWEKIRNVQFLLSKIMKGALKRAHVQVLQKRFLKQKFVLGVLGAMLHDLNYLII